MTMLNPNPVGPVIGPSLLPSVLRTVVPLIYAMLVRWGVTEWIDPDDLFVTNLITVVVTALFYVALRLMERHWDKIGWLLGYAAPPVYTSGPVVAGEVEGVIDVPVGPGDRSEGPAKEAAQPEMGVARDVTGTTEQVRKPYSQ